MWVNILEQSLYIQYFCLSLYSKKHPVKPSTLYHILVGKRTASILFKAHSYHAINFFSIFPYLQREQYDEMMQLFISKGWIKAKKADEDFYLCEKGKKEIESYFSKHFYPTRLNQLTQGKATKEFWEKIIFLTQVLSELRYKNNHYLPIEKEFKTQLWVKKWLKRNQLEKQELAISYGKEWIQVLKEMDAIDAEMIVSQLTGHEKIGKTSTQLAAKYGVEPIEIAFLLQNAIIQLMEKVAENKEKYPFFYLVYQECVGDRFSSLSQSTKITAHYLEKGLSVEKIAVKRKLKLNTISEHVIELAIIFPDFKVSSFMPQDEYERLNGLFNSHEEITYEELTSRMPSAPFYWYRLIQVERSRVRG